jgi:AraC-like DNA-binding protein
MQTIIYLAISQSLFSAILVLTKKDVATSDKLLSTWLILMSIELISCLFDLYFFGETLISSIFLLINPAFYLYIKSLTQADFRLRYSQLLHLIPYLSFEGATYVIQEPFKVNFLDLNNPHLWFSLSFSVINILSWLYYNISSIIMVHRHRVNLKNEFSNIEPETRIAWLLFILIFYVVYCSFILITGILALNIHDLITLPNVYNLSMMLILAYVLGFYGLKQRQVGLPRQNGITGIKSDTKYKSSVLTKSDKETIKERIIHYFETKKPYLNQNFNLASLSKELDIPKHYLTEVLNIEIGMNFFSFVNDYRIRAVKKMLQDESVPYSIEAIGYECGFNSKSSFFTVFKSITGMTPLQFRSKQEKS